MRHILLALLVWQAVAHWEVDINTLLGWLVQAASHVEVVSRYMLHDLHLDQVQMDELCALLSQMGEGQEDRNIWY